MSGMQVTERWWATRGTRTKKELVVERKASSSTGDSWNLRGIPWASPDRTVEIQSCPPKLIKKRRAC